MDFPCIRQINEEFVVGEISFPSLNAYLVTEDKLCKGIFGIPYVSVTPPRSKGSMLLSRESSASDIQTNEVAAPPSGLMTGGPMKVDTKVEKVFLTSLSDIFEDGSTSSSPNPYPAEPVYRFANQQSHDSYIKIPHSTYQALLKGKVSSYSSHSQFSSLSVRIKKPQTVRSVLTSEVKGHNIIDTNPETSVCLSATTTLDNYSCEVVEDNACLVQDCSSSYPDHSSVIDSAYVISTPSSQVFYMDEEVTTTWSNLDIVPLQELCIPMSLSMQSQKNFLQSGSLTKASRATGMRHMTGKRRHFPRRPFSPSTFSTNCSFTCKTSCGRKRKAITYNEDDAIRPFTQRRIFILITYRWKTESLGRDECCPDLLLTVCDIGGKLGYPMEALTRDQEERDGPPSKTSFISFASSCTSSTSSHMGSSCPIAHVARADETCGEFI